MSLGYQHNRTFLAQNLHSFHQLMGSFFMRVVDASALGHRLGLLVAL